MQVAPNVTFLDRATPPHIVTLTLMAALAAMNMAIFLPSLNTMAIEFGASYAKMQLAVSGYLAATAIFQIVIGPLSDRYGRRNVTLVTFAAFIVATIGAGMSNSVEAFLTFRILQATVASGIILSRAVVRDMVPANQAASMIGYVTMGMALLPMIGPMIGGVLDQAFGWRASFAFLTVCGIGVFALCFFDLGETVQGGGQSFREQIAGYPALFASPRFWGYVLCTTFASGAFFSFLGGGSFVADSVYGLSPMMTGVALGSPAVGYILGNFFSGRYATRFGVNSMTMTGTLISTFGLAMSLVVSMLGYETARLFFGFCILLGLGNGLTMPNATAGLLSVRPQLAGTASGLGGAIMIGGGAALSQLAGNWLTVESGAMPLQLMMLVTSALSVVAILFVIFRTRAVSA